MPKPEAAAVAAVNKKLHTAVWHEGNGGGFVNGKPDQYYEGPAGALWIEYKFALKLPRLLNLCNVGKSPSLSKLQHAWVNRAHTNGVNVAVVLLTKEDGNHVFTNREWELVHKKETLVAYSQLTRQGVAKWIESIVLKN